MLTAAQSIDILERVIGPNDDPMPEAVARYVQQWSFARSDHDVYEALSLKAQDGTLTSDERDLLEGYLQVDGLISLLKLKARRSLRA
jgi:hypothetical protein